jgi:hypothetical protein
MNLSKLTWSANGHGFGRINPGRKPPLYRGERRIAPSFMKLVMPGLAAFTKASAGPHCRPVEASA